ncbi:hypothetical protein KUA19_27085 [Catellatospora sp. NEAU-YM18]|nr:hypothetical protein [Catellatospora tritici]MBV1853805.1 hypothetical protein [Catellatospora tritici]
MRDLLGGELLLGEGDEVRFAPVEALAKLDLSPTAADVLWHFLRSRPATVRGQGPRTVAGEVRS